MTKILIAIKALLAVLINFEIKRQDKKVVQFSLRNAEVSKARAEAMRDLKAQRTEAIKRANDEYRRKADTVNQQCASVRRKNTKRANEAAMLISQLQD